MFPTRTPFTFAILLAQQASRLPQPLRAKLMMALLGIIVLGLGMVVMVLLGGWAVKRTARRRSGPSSPRDDAWYQKPLEPEAPADTAASDNHGE